MVTLNDMDPLVYQIPDPIRMYFEPFFKPLKISSYSGLKARRLYAYSSLIENLKLLRDSELMKQKITEIWQKHNALNDFENQKRKKLFEYIFF